MQAMIKTYLVVILWAKNGNKNAASEIVSTHSAILHFSTLCHLLPCLNYLFCIFLSRLGLIQRNLNSFEFKFDDTRHSSWYKNKIGLIEKIFCCVLTLLCLCPFGSLSLEMLKILLVQSLMILHSWFPMRIICRGLSSACNVENAKVDDVC